MAITKKELLSIQNLETIPGIASYVTYDDKGYPTGISIAADDGFYLRVNHVPKGAPKVKFPWRFVSPSPLPARCKAHHFTLRHLIHRALNWMDLEKE